MKKKLPRLRSDNAAEDFVAKADLTEYDLSAMRPIRFEFQPKSERVNMRLPGNCSMRCGPRLLRRDFPTSASSARRWRMRYSGTRSRAHCRTYAKIVIPRVNNLASRSDSINFILNYTS